MSKQSGKGQAKSWEPPAVQSASKGFAARPFPEIAKKQAGREASLDSSGMKDIKPGTAIENINRAIASASPPVPPPTVLPGGVQAKLTLGAPGDKYEQEADRVARQVVDEIHSSAFRANNTRTEGESQPNGGEAGRVQRQITVRAAGDAGGEISSAWEGELQRARSGGQPLSSSVREPMERAFGADFSGVRVHTGAQADRLARSIQAKAFTTGQDVFFRQGAYEPGSRGGQEVIAHELTHVEQQKNQIKQHTQGGNKVRRYTIQYANVLYNESGYSGAIDLIEPEEMYNAGSPVTAWPSWWPTGPAETANDYLRENFVQGHIINQRLGGSGSDRRNLTPLTRSANSQMYATIESMVFNYRKEKKNEKNAVSFVAWADYNTHPTVSDVKADHLSLVEQGKLQNELDKMPAWVYGQLTTFYLQQDARDGKYYWYTHGKQPKPKGVKNEDKSYTGSYT